MTDVRSGKANAVVGAGVDSLKGVKLAVIKDYTYFPELDACIKANPSGVRAGFGEDPLRDNLRLLLGGSVDVVVDNPAVLAYTADRMGSKSKVTAAGNGGEPLKMYIAFSPADPKSREYVNMLSTGIAALRKSGELKKVLARYGLSDWK